ncbi:MAG: pyridoxal-phosphate dependent enzyme [Solirubrobacterales bacterium]
MHGRDLTRLLDAPTPLQALPGDLWVKRDDLFEALGATGGKARTCLSIITEGGTPGGVAITASSRQSPQAIIVARIAAGLGLTSRIHMPAGAETPEMEAARAAGAVVGAHKPGYNSVIIKRADDDAAQTPGAVLVPFGMECQEAIEQTRRAVAQTEIPAGVRRVVVAVGSGMTLAGLLHGLPPGLPVLGVRVGADPAKRLDKYAPDWRARVELVEASEDYHKAVDATLDGIKLDPIYEAKCKPYLKPGDLFWIVGNREGPEGAGVPR